MSAAVMLALAIVTEVLGTVLLRLSDGMSKLAPSLGMAVSYVISIALLGQALKHLDLGFAYAIWAGAGTALIAMVGVAAWNEPITGVKLASLVAVIVGVFGLNLSSAH